MGNPFDSVNEKRFGVEQPLSRKDYFAGMILQGMISSSYNQLMREDEKQEKPLGPIEIMDGLSAIAAHAAESLVKRLS